MSKTHESPIEWAKRMSRTRLVSETLDELLSDIDHALRPTAPSMTIAERVALVTAKDHLEDAARSVRRARMAARKAEVTR